jgi:hypothetical protein
MLDVCLRRKLITQDSHQRGKQLIERIVSMLVKLASRMSGSERRERERTRPPEM